MSTTANCSHCGAPIIWAQNERGEKLKLNSSEIGLGGSTRVWTVIDYVSTPWVVRRNTSGHAEHVCGQVMA